VEKLWKSEKIYLWKTCGKRGKSLNIIRKIGQKTFKKECKRDAETAIIISVQNRRTLKKPEQKTWQLNAKTPQQLPRSSS
jgi:hypothetical protein